MSREIKFRLYNTRTKEWLCGYKECGGFHLLGEVVLMSAFDFPLEDINNIEQMQYTGLKDKNGTEIYEGDVVEAKTVERSPIAPDYVSGYLKGVIEYYDNAFCIKYKDKKGQYIYNHLWTNAEEWRVLGNIHEHPHLMEEQQ